MRYRPFGGGGRAVSNLTLSLGPAALQRGPEAARELIFSALENGINSYRLETADPVLAEVVGDALQHLERKLLCISLALGAGDGRRGSERDFSAEALTAAIDRALNVSGLQYVDIGLLMEPAEDELAQSSLNALKALRAAERLKLLGVCGEGEVMDAYVSTGAFDLLATPYHVNSPWQVKSRMRAAREQDMIIFAHGYFPDSLSTPRKAEAAHKPKKGLFGFGGGKAARPKSDPLAGVGTFAFLHRTQAWSAEEICLNYALTDPAVASVVIEATDPERLEALARTSERDMPPGLPAQIEMARFAAA